MAVPYPEVLGLPVTRKVVKGTAASARVKKVPQQVGRSSKLRATQAVPSEFRECFFTLVPKRRQPPVRGSLSRSRSVSSKTSEFPVLDDGKTSQSGSSVRRKRRKRRKMGSEMSEVSTGWDIDAGDILLPQIEKGGKKSPTTWAPRRSSVASGRLSPKPQTAKPNGKSAFASLVGAAVVVEHAKTRMTARERAMRAASASERARSITIRVDNYSNLQPSLSTPMSETEDVT